LLLEWCASAEQERKTKGSLLASWDLLWSAPVIALAVTAALVILQPTALPSAAPLLVLWFIAPFSVWWLGLPLERKEASLSGQQTQFLRKIARKTWAYFERFVVAEDNWLPPDNFQENPGPVIAHRTSPTNIGLALLGNLSAYDFGFISANVLLERTANTFGSMGKLERHRGHFFNWYDTLTLRPLPPRYISAVDSGNLAGHLLTLRAGLVALPDQSIPHERVFHGLADTLAVLTDSLQFAHMLDDLPHVVEAAIIRLRSLLNSACAHTHAERINNLPALLHCLEGVMNAAVSINAYLAVQPNVKLAVSGALLNDMLGAPVIDHVGLAHEAKTWGAALAQQSRSALDELLFFAPWLGLRAPPPALGGFVATLAHFTPGIDLNRIPSLRLLTTYNLGLVPLLDAQLLRPGTVAEREWLLELRGLIVTASQRANERIATCMELAAQANEFAAMEYDFLYDRTRHLIAVGYNLDDYRRDNSFYDLLASEARLCNFVAIAQGQVPQESWFALGRLRTMAEGEPVLMSWSGSMFEYLMPMLVMPSYDGTLLDQTCRAAVGRQIAYGKQRNLPWGISESGYHTFDASLNYQYHAFGVPGLGFKRGLAEDTVISPYASVMALMVAPEAACENLEWLAGNGVEGRFGFYEAVDYTPSRLARPAPVCARLWFTTRA
jgi:hypothetical protein